MTLKIMVTRRFATSGTTRPTTQRHIQENTSLQLWDLVKDEARYSLTVCENVNFWGRTAVHGPGW
jgi:hypothetical protein